MKTIMQRVLLHFTAKSDMLSLRATINGIISLPISIHDIATVDNLNVIKCNVNNDDLLIRKTLIPQKSLLVQLICI